MLNSLFFQVMQNDLNYKVEEISRKLTLLLDRMDSIEEKVNPQDEEEWLDSKGAARFLNVSLRSIMNYRLSGQIPCSKVAGKLYFNKIDLIKVLNDGKVN